MSRTKYPNTMLYLLLISYLTTTSTAETEPPIGDQPDELFESLANCSTYHFDLEPDEYVLFPNGTAYVSAYNRTYEPNSYYPHDGLLSVCAPDAAFEGEDDGEVGRTNSTRVADEPLEYITKVGMGVSVACLVVHLVVFCMVKDMRNLPGYNLASLCLSLLLSYASLVASKFDLPGAACVASALLTQFFFLSSFLWMAVISVDVFRSILLATGSLRATSKGFKVKKYLLNSCVSWGVSLVFSAAALLADTLEGVPESFRPNFREKCWFGPKQSLLVFFAGPFFAVICLNFALFAASAFTVYSHRMRPGDGATSRLNSDNHVMYFRLAVVMGATWVTGVAAALVHQVWLWYVFALLNTLQGLFILLAFTCTAKVRKFFVDKVFGGRRPSESNLTTPTFQSYCFYANSLDKDMDKVGEGKEKSGPIDTIVIHI